MPRQWQWFNSQELLQKLEQEWPEQTFRLGEITDNPEVQQIVSTGATAIEDSPCFNFHQFGSKTNSNIACHLLVCRDRPGDHPDCNHDKPITDTPGFKPFTNSLSCFYCYLSFRDTTCTEAKLLIKFWYSICILYLLN